jgi:tetratricopeptide (TPR) repeat protein
MELVSKKPTLCLNMIVKNESRIIRRLFDSVISIIDSYCICDTGSTDNTIQIIEEYFKEKGLNGKIVNEPFKNFCHNRNFGLQACIGLSDYVLLLDADMILETKHFDKSILNKANSFSILQGNDSFYYQNVRIVKNNGLYNYVGVTHEYINTPENNTVICLNKKDIFIRDIGDGGSKSDKFERDIRLLLDGIKDEPNNGRYHFYLANTYHDSGRFEDAIQCYKKRIEIGGWKEEIWYSYYRIGLCYKNMDKFTEAMKYWLDGYNYYPERLEAIYEIIRHYRNNSKHNLCMIFYKCAKDILNKNENRDSYLFLHNDVYLHKIYYEYTIFAAYCGIKNINDEIITICNNSSGTDVDNLISNMKFYKQILLKKSLYNLDNTINTVINGENITLYSSSSCLIKNPNSNGYLLNIRYVNYFIDGNGFYKNCDKHIITVNKFVVFDNKFNVIKEEWMDLLFDGRRYIGIEDIRIYYDNYSNKLIYIGTGYHSNEKIGVVSGNYIMDEKKLEINELKQNFNNTSCEKNWVFVDYKNDTHVIYEWYPLKICTLKDNNELSVIEVKNMPKLFSRVRGSTCGFRYNKKIGDRTTGTITVELFETEIWFVNHIVSYESPRHYYHIISVFDSNMNLLRYSAPFKFEGEPIEYCLSIVVEDENVLMNYSVWDRTTKIGVYDKKYIDSLLKYLKITN